MLLREDLTLWSVSDVMSGEAVPSAQLSEFRAILGWTHEFLMNEHAELGRTGAVCPFTHTSVAREIFYFAKLPVESSIEATRSTVRAYGKWFRELLTATPEPDRAFLSFVLLMDPSASFGPDVEWVQKASKNRFVRDGLMVGQFYPACDEPGLRNPSFRPLRSPLPLLVIRVMTRHDLPFLMDDPKYVEAYFSRFASAIPASMRSQLADVLAQHRATTLQEAPMQTFRA